MTGYVRMIKDGIAEAMLVVNLPKVIAFWEGRGWEVDPDGPVPDPDPSTLVTQGQLTTALAGKQNADPDLTTIAGLTPVNDDVLQRKAGAWTSRTLAQLGVDLGLDGKAAATDLASEAGARAAADTALDGRLDIVEAALPGKADASDLAEIATSGKLADAVDLDPTGAQVGGVYALRQPSAGAFALTQIEPLAAPATPLALTTYDTNPSVGHPSVVFAPTGFGGHRWWMAATPYPDASRENPCLWWSDNGFDWTAHPGNPVTPLPEMVAAGFAYSSDTHLIRVDTQLWLFWRSATANTKNAIFRKTSTDGLTWSAATKVVEDLTAETSLNSPAIVREADGSFTMWVADGSISTAPVVRRRTSPDGLTWSAPAACTLPTGQRVWHLDVQRVGGTYHMLVNSISEKADRLHYLTSTDGLTWAGDMRNPAIEAGGGTFPAARYYRSCLVPRPGTPHRWHVFTTVVADSPSETWRVALLPDTTLPTPQQQAALESLRMDRIAGALGAEVRWRQGDTFARADNASGLGTSSSGIPWTTLAGTPTIVGGAAHAPSASARAQLGDSGLSDAEIAVDFTAIGEAWVMLRIVDDSNWLRIGTDNNTGRIAVDKRVAGAITRVTTVSENWARIREGDRLRVRAQGTALEIWLNTVLVTTVTVTDHVTATKHGISLGGAGGRVKNFAVGALA